MGSYRSDFDKWLIPPLKKANRVLAVSRYLVSELDKYGVNAQFISNFINDAFFKPSYERFVPFTFVAIGRLESQKNYKLMLNAAHLLKQKEEPFQLKIIGAGSEKSGLESLSTALGLDEIVTFLGECNRDEVRYHLDTSNILINTSLHENQPVAMLEALASGLPVLSTSWQGARDFITPNLGKVVGFEKVEISREMNLMIQSAHSKTRTREAYEESFSSEKVISDLEALYNSLI
jgi:glycosyltransferase involved in cell wall biosynthesis